MKTHIQAIITLILLLAFFVWGHFHQAVFVKFFAGLALLALLAILYLCLYNIFKSFNK